MKAITKEYRDRLFRHYMIAALCTTTDTVNGKDVELDIFTPKDIHPDTKEKMRTDCNRFIDANAADLEDIDPEEAGYDFWLTRCGHGAGFWDRGLGEVGDRLAAACGHGTAFPNVDLYIGDDGKIHQ